ncbi:MAG: hypothetical protein COA42_04940 [Alteromonadaceae bacterium]|nr:MAG: hypothetical protein COA42_04940 [Alteromonadaceae bacterium]
MNTNPQYLGTGWSFPPKFTKGGQDVHMVSGEQDVHESLQILLGTRLGERILRSDYGCDLSRYVFGTVDDGFASALGSLVRQSLTKNEPRIRLESVGVKQSDDEAGLIELKITYLIHQTNSRYNMVYPFYINEALQTPVSK